MCSEISLTNLELSQGIKQGLWLKGTINRKGDYGETFALVAPLESIRLLVTHAAHKGFKLFQMDLKTAFLNGALKEEVFVHQPPGFEDKEHPKHVFILKKALYGVKQAPRA